MTVADASPSASRRPSALSSDALTTATLSIALVLFLLTVIAFPLATLLSKSFMNADGRIIVCGMIADYNTDKPSPGPNWLNIIRKRLTITGFTMPDHWDKVPAMMQKLTAYYMAGKLKYRAHKLQGLESAIDGINLLFTGGNTGKLMVVL